VRFYPFVLGAQPVRPIDLAAFYATIATEGLRPAPYVVESITRDGQVIYRHQQTASIVESVDQAAFYQLKTMLQGVLARGTASAIAGLAPYVAGKTGTSDDANDVWFVGLTNDVTVAIWIGYDNADGKRRTLGDGATGGSIAVPIFEPIIQAVWANGVARTVLAPPSPESKRRLACTSSGRRGAFSECLRINAKGRVLDTENVLLSGKGDETNSRLTNYMRVQAPSAQSEKLVETQGSAVHTKADGEADTSEKIAGVKAADNEENGKVSRSRKYRGAKAKPDSAKQDREASRSRRNARANRTYASARRPSSGSDPWRSQWNWQGQYGRSQWSWQSQYGQTSSWGRWR
jgi:membrane peptidoglycan carboxypeptidase